MSKVSEGILRGLQEAVAYTEGKLDELPHRPRRFISFREIIDEIDAEIAAEEDDELENDGEDDKAEKTRK